MKRMGLLVLMICFLSGCLYPQEKKLQLDQLPIHVKRVQSAVDRYYQEKKVLPYRYRADELKFTSKAIVNFDALQGYIDQIPPSAYENGGIFIYVLTNVEEKPLVRLFDLRVNDQVEKLQTIIAKYKKDHRQLPIKEKIDEKHSTIDFQKLGIDEMVIPSPYDASANLPLIIDHTGRVLIDYRAEVMKLIQQTKQKPKENEDLRGWIANHSLYVPAFSSPMKFEENEPIFTSLQE